MEFVSLGILHEFEVVLDTEVRPVYFQILVSSFRKLQMCPATYSNFDQKALPLFNQRWLYFLSLLTPFSLSNAGRESFKSSQLVWFYFLVSRFHTDFSDSSAVLAKHFFYLLQYYERKSLEEGLRWKACTPLNRFFNRLRVQMVFSLLVWCLIAPGPQLSLILGKLCFPLFLKLLQNNICVISPLIYIMSRN